jgi:transcriptional regulator with XRE-family HTH domain
MEKKMKRFHNVAKLMRLRRIELGLSQSQTAKLIGFVRGQFVSNVERALCSVPPKKIESTAKVLQVDPSEIINAILEDERIFMHQILSKDKFAAMTEKQHREIKLEERELVKCQKTTQQIKPVLYVVPEQKEETVTTTSTQEKPIQNTPKKLGTLSPLVEAAINNFFTQNL